MYAVFAVCAPSGVTDWNGINFVHSNYNVKRLPALYRKGGSPGLFTRPLEGLSRMS